MCVVQFRVLKNKACDDAYGVLTVEVAFSGRYLDGGRSLRVAVVVVCVVPAHAVGVSQAVEGAHRAPPLVPELTTVNNGSANQQP